MKKLALNGAIIVWSFVIVCLILFYVDAYLCLNTDLRSIYDEGFFFLNRKKAADFAIYSHPFTFESELWRSVFPNVGEWDILTHRRVAFGLELAGLVIMVFASCFFFGKNGRKSLRFMLSLIACVLLVGLFDLAGGEIGNGHECQIFIETLVVSLSLLAVSMNKDWLKSILVTCVGFVGVFAVLCNEPGGGLLFLISVLFLIFYDGFHTKRMFAIFAWLLLGVVLALLVMNYAVISFSDCVGVFKEAVSKTTGGQANNHSLGILFLSIPFAARDLVMTVTALLGVSYVYRLIKDKTSKRWISIVIGIVLFFILYKWQVKPSIGFVSIITWISFMLWENRGFGIELFKDKEFLLFLYLYLVPFCLSFGTNVGILNRAVSFIIPWGILVCFIGVLIAEKDILISGIYYVAVFLIVSLGIGMHLIRLNKWENYSFENEKPVARMHLTKAQSDYYHEVYDVLGEYGYVSRQDTLLGFCFDEMTVVVMDAVPYSNMQIPHELLYLDRAKLVKPTFMILSEWDTLILNKTLRSMDWDYPESYDVFKLKNSADPNAGLPLMQSSLYCLKSRRKQ